MTQIKWIENHQVIKKFVDDECIRQFDKRLFRKHLSVIKKASDERLDQIEKEVAWDYALKVLTRRRLFSKELREKLSLRMVSQKTIDAVLEKTKRYDYINDARDLEESIRLGLLKSKGPFRMVNELGRRSGFDKEEIAVLLNRCVSEEDLIERGKKLIQKYQLPKERNKAYARLARRGFSLEIIQKILHL